jgi:hypothetical protein
MAPNQTLADRFEGDAFFSGEVGEPELSPRIHVGMEADQILDLMFKPLVKRVVSRAHIREFGIATLTGPHEVVRVER